jgi:predicted alpha/beta-fold hydrolase
VSYRREPWSTPDNDIIAVDWLHQQETAGEQRPLDPATRQAPGSAGDHGRAATMDSVTSSPGMAPFQGAASIELSNPADGIASTSWVGPPGQPTLALFHGLEGGSESHYSRAFMGEAGRRQWNGCVVHFRGCGGFPNRRPRAYHSGDSEEIDWVLRRLRARVGGPLFVVGISLGGNALLKWLGEIAQGAQGVIDAAAAVCPPQDLRAGAYALAAGFNRLYMHNFLRSLIPGALALLERFPGLYDAQKVRGCSSFIDFDEVVTAPLHGFPSAEEYWRRSSCGPFLASIRAPTLVVNTLNDPFIPVTCLRRTEAVSQAVRLSYTPQGGHVGFPVGHAPGRIDYLPRKVGEWFDAVSGESSRALRNIPEQHRGESGQDLDEGSRQGPRPGPPQGPQQGPRQGAPKAEHG